MQAGPGAATAPQEGRGGAPAEGQRHSSGQVDAGSLLLTFLARTNGRPQSFTARGVRYVFLPPPVTWLGQRSALH